MRLYKRFFAVMVTIFMLLGSCIAPMSAIATDDNTSSATSAIQEIADVNEQPVAVPAAGDSEVAETAGVAEQQQPQNESQAAEQPEKQPEGQPCVSGKYLGGSDFIPGYTVVAHQAPGSDNNTVKIDVDENYDVVVGSQSKAYTGTSDAAGTNVTNSVGGTSQAAAVNGSGEPIESTEPNSGGTYAGNEVIKSIDNLGTATAIAGKSEAQNEMDDNEAKIAPETCFSANVSGKIIDSNVKVNAQLNYYALIAGLSEALSGDSSATGTNASNDLNSNDKAIAKGDSSPLADGDIYSGAVVSKNDSENSISNDGAALSETGESNADNIMKENDIAITPTVKAILNVCGDVINSNVTINLVYNFLAVISGYARAATGDSNVSGAVVENSIDNLTNSTAVGDSSMGSAGESSSGGAVATNDTSNNIDNEGNAYGLSGDADALNKMLNNAIAIAPVICSQVDLLDSIINANVVINVVYNFWAFVSGEANAETGGADANGLVADNSINNKSNSLAIGDSAGAGLSGSGDGSGNGNATGINDTNNSISNKGDAGSITGDAAAINSMLGNAVNLSPVIATAVILITPIAGNSYVIDVAYNIWTSLDGSANSKTGDADSLGVLCDSSIDSNSEAVALAKIGLGYPDGSATALNSSDNQIGSVGNAAAASGNAGAASNLSNAIVSMTGSIKDDTVFDNCQESTDKQIAFKAGIDEEADAQTGNAAAVGVVAGSHMMSRAVSKDIFGRDGISINDSDDDIANTGQASAASGDAWARSGAFRGVDDSYNNSGDVILIGFNRPDAEHDSARTLSQKEAVFGEADAASSGNDESNVAKSPDGDNADGNNSVNDDGSSNSGEDVTGGSIAGDGNNDSNDYANASTNTVNDSNNGTNADADGELFAVSHVGEGTSMANGGVSGFLSDYLEPVIGADACDGNPVSSNKPWWLWVAGSLLIIGIGVAFVVRSKYLLAQRL